MGNRCSNIKNKNKLKNKSSKEKPLHAKANSSRRGSVSSLKRDPKNFTDGEESLSYPLQDFDWKTDQVTLRHFLYRFIWQGNFLSPVEEKLKVDGKVLDIGCGSGVWAREIATEFPLTTVTGLDFADSVQTNDTPLPNLIFTKGNILENLPIENDTFDFVHARFLGTTFNKKEWREIIIPELVRVTKPGGYLEIMEIDADLSNQGTAAQYLVAAVQAYLRNKGISPILTPHIKSFLQSSHLINLKKIEECIPIGNWGDKAGEVALMDWQQTFEKYQDQVIPFLEVDAQGYKDLVTEFKTEVDVFQTYAKSVRVYGMKPLPFLQPEKEH
ncbi:hypothetical protein G9A89_021778 [Geosiphon pyriformis]|nr:hypothetical protein G9A89_021778 [Geosiphon pyriformis]